MKYTCNLIIANKPTVNGRVYSQECMETMHAQLMERIESDRAVIDAGGYSISATGDRELTPEINLSNIAGKITNAELTDRIILEIEPLESMPMSGLLNLVDDGVAEITPMIVCNVSDGNVDADSIKYIKHTIVHKNDPDEKKVEKSDDTPEK